MKIQQKTTLEYIMSGYKPNLSVQEMAKLVGLSKDTMRRICVGEFEDTPPPPMYRLGKAWRCNMRDFTAWLDSLPVDYARVRKHKK